MNEVNDSQVLSLGVQTPIFQCTAFCTRISHSLTYDLSGIVIVLLICRVLGRLISRVLGLVLVRVLGRG